jgi:SAM-dependent methyltransferase
MIEILKEHKDLKSLMKGYAYIFKDKGIKHRESFYIWILNTINIQRYQNKRLLDLACGEGCLVSIARSKGVAAIGIDISLQALQNNSYKGYLLLGNGEKLPFDGNSFDIVTCIGSLEHFVDPLVGAREIYRVLVPNGVACILLPNTYSLFGNILFAAKTGDVFDDGQPIQRYNTAQGWYRLLSQAGLTVRKIIKYELFPPKTLRDLWWYVVHPKKFLRYLLTPLVPLYLANCFVYLCEKVDAAAAQYADLRIDIHQRLD